MLAESHAFQNVEVDYVQTAKGQRTVILEYWAADPATRAIKSIRSRAAL